MIDDTIKTAIASQEAENYDDDIIGDDELDSDDDDDDTESDDRNDMGDGEW